MTDIMQEYKNKRFWVAPNYIAHGLTSAYGYIVVLSDISYWAENIDNLITWCEETGCEQKGMTVDVPTDELLTLFCLRWA